MADDLAAALQAIVGEALLNGRLADMERRLARLETWSAMPPYYSPPS